MLSVSHRSILNSLHQFEQDCLSIEDRLPGNIWYITQTRYDDDILRECAKVRPLESEHSTCAPFRGQLTNS